MLRTRLATLLRERRVAAGFTQEQMAKHCGCTCVTYSALESKGSGSVETLLKALHGLDVVEPALQSIAAQGVAKGRRRVMTAHAGKSGEEW